MKRSALLVVLLIMTVAAMAQSPGMFTDNYRVEVRWTDLKEGMVILGHHFGNTQYTIDTAYVDSEGVCVFEGEGDTLRYGVYLVYVPGQRYFDFLLAEPEITLETSLANPEQDMNVIASKENELFFDYIGFLSSRMNQARDIQSRQEGADEATLAGLEAERKSLDQEVKAYMSNFISNNKGTFAASVVSVNQQIEVPEPPKDENGNVLDEAFQYQYYYSHFWDNVDLTDERLLYSLWIEPKVKQYMTELTLQHPDSVIKAADRLVTRTGDNKEMFRYVVNWITNHYETSNLMSSESVFVHMVQNYYTEDQAWWVDAATLFRIQDRARILAPLLIGKKIPNLVIKDNANEFHNLHREEGSYTVLFFYDPDCGHCQKTAPIMEETRKKLEAEGAVFWGVALDLEDTPADREKWQSFIDEKGLAQWINVADLEHRIPIKYTYDVRSTPTIIVLNKDKEIILRRLGPEQLSEVMEDVIRRDKEEAQESAP